MSDRREYHMAEDQHERLMDASKPVMMIAPGGVWPPSPQENANAAWAALGREMGFDPWTVRPVPGKDTRWFSAVPEGDHG